MSHSSQMEHDGAGQLFKLAVDQPKSSPPALRVPEILSMVLERVDPLHEVLTCKSVCKLWNAAIDGTPSIQRRLFLTHVPCKETTVDSRLVPKETIEEETGIRVWENAVITIRGGGKWPATMNELKQQITHHVHDYCSSVKDFGIHPIFLSPILTTIPGAAARTGCLLLNDTVVLILPFETLQKMDEMCESGSPEVIQSWMRMPATNPPVSQLILWTSVEDHHNRPGTFRVDTVETNPNGHGVMLVDLTWRKTTLTFRS